MAEGIIKKTCKLEEFVELLFHVNDLCNNSWVTELSHLQIYDPKILYSKETESRTSEENLKKAVFTLAYLYRAKCLNILEQNLDHFKDTENLKKFIINITIPAGDYFLNLLSWIAFMFEMTMCCYRNEYKSLLNGDIPYEKRKELLNKCLEYIETAKGSVAVYSGTLGFKKCEAKGRGWHSLLTAASCITVFHDYLVKILEDKRPRYDILPLFHAVIKSNLKHPEEEMKLKKIARGKWKKYFGGNTQLLHASNSPSMLRGDYFVFGHIVREKKCSGKISEMIRNLSVQDAQLAPGVKENLLQVTKEDELTAGVSDHQVCESEGIEKDEYLYRNSVFVMSERCLKKRTIVETPTCRRKIKIHTPPDVGVIENLYADLYDIIKRGNRLHVGEDLFAFYSRDCNETDISHSVIIDTSSEEESDDEFDTQSKMFISELQKRKGIELIHLESMNSVLKFRIWETKISVSEHPQE